MFVFDVGKTGIEILKEEALVVGTQNSCQCVFLFSPEWDGLDRTVVFISKTSRVSRSCVLGPDNRCMIPWEVLEKWSTNLFIGVYGTRGGEQILITERKDLGEIRPGTIPAGAAQPPTPEVYDQILAAANQAVSKVDALRQEADSGSFHGRDGLTPYIRDGNWWIGDQDTGVQADGSVPDLTQLRQELEALAGNETARHNTAAEAHSDIRLLIQGLAVRLNALANSDDTTLDQMAEVVAYIKDNRDLIGQVTTGKVSVGDIIDNLTTSVRDKPLSARQGAALKSLIDALTATVAGKALASDLAAALGRISTLEGGRHAHGNQAELDKIQTGDKAKWDAAQAGALADAKAWVNQQGFADAGQLRETAGTVAAVTAQISSTTKTINLNDGVYEYGRFAAAGTEYDKDNPITGAFRNINYLPVEGGRTITVYYAKAEWNSDNAGWALDLVEYDTGKNVIGTRKTLPTWAANKNGMTLDPGTAFIRTDFNRSGTAIATPLSDIQIGIYYLDEYVNEYMPPFLTATATMVPRERVYGLDPLSGKKIIYDGDSICESRLTGTAANGGGYAKLIADYTGGTYVNQASGGARLCASTENHSLVGNLENLPKNGDLYCFEGGINDFWANTPIGSCDASDYAGALDPSTICGALETIFRYCLTNFVGKPVCFVIAHKVLNTGYDANASGDTFADYRNSMIQVCNKYSIPYYDAFMESGLNGWHTAQKNAFLTANGEGTPDGTHPNEEGYRRYYVPQLLELFRRMAPAE